jgi:hypothetical protein
LAGSATSGYGAFTVATITSGTGTVSWS